jgi:hypothetical protein
MENQEIVFNTDPITQVETGSFPERVIIRRQLPGDGTVAYTFTDKLGNEISVYNDRPLKTGKKYKDSGYSGSVRRRMAKNV